MRSSPGQSFPASTQASLAAAASSVNHTPSPTYSAQEIVAIVCSKDEPKIGVAQRLQSPAIGTDNNKAPRHTLNHCKAKTFKRPRRKQYVVIVVYFSYVHRVFDKSSEVKAGMVQAGEKSCAPPRPITVTRT